MTPVLMEEAYWANSQFSVARYYGGIRMKEGSLERTLQVVNKHGITAIELSDPDSKHYVKGDKAIPPGEPCDLIDTDFIPYYKALGRDKFIEILNRNHHTSREILKRIYKEEVSKKRK